jgi:hypothetical protein
MKRKARLTEQTVNQIKSKGVMIQLELHRFKHNTTTVSFLTDPSRKQLTPTAKISLRSCYPVPTPAARVHAAAASTSWLRTIATPSPRDKTTTNQLATARNRRRSPTTACHGTGEAQRVDNIPQPQLAAAQRGSR